MKYVLLIMLACSSGFYLEAMKYSRGRPQDADSDKAGPAPRSIGTHLLELFRRPELTLKDAKRIYDETNQETVRASTINYITDREAKLFCDTNREDIMQVGRDLLHSPEFGYLESLENSLAALWFLLECEKIRTVFENKEKTEVAQLISTIIDNSEHTATLLRWVNSVDKTPNSDVLRAKAIRAARLIALFSSDTEAKRTCAKKYAALAKGTDELSLDCYSKNYPGHQKKGALTLPSINQSGQPDSIDESVSDDEDDQNNFRPIQTRSRGRSVLRRIFIWGTAALGIAGLIAAGAFAYKKYGTKKPLPKTSA